MAVQSYLNLYTWLLGWQLYDQIWAFLANVGILAVPFAWISYKAVFDPLVAGHKFKDVGDKALTRLLAHMLIAVFILLVVGLPAVEMKPSSVNYTPTCVKDAKTVTANNTGTTYDNLVAIPDSIQVPFWWYLVMAISNGVTDQFKSFVACPVVDLRALQAQLSTTAIKSPQTKAEVARFRSECYLPAYNRYIHLQDKTKEQEVEDAIKKYGADDVSWMGSETFQTVAGFYDTLYAQSPVKGFPYMGTDQDQIQSQTGQPEWGTPSCKTWWQDDSNGLRQTLYNSFDKHTQETLAEAMGSANLNMAQNGAVYSMMVKDTGGNFINRGYSSEEDKTPENFMGKVAASVGADWTATEQFPKIHMLQNMLPIFQALVQYVVFFLLSIMLVFSGYSFRFVLSGTFFVFALIFMSFLWSTVTFVDNFLMQAMYHSYRPDGTYDAFSSVVNMALGKVNPNANTLDFVVSTFYVGVTLILLFMGGWLGWQGGTAIAGNSRTMEGISQDGGGKGGKLISTIAKFIK